VGSKAVWQARGGGKTILLEEQPVINFAYATVVSISPIRAGETLSLDNVWVKRPGTGEIRADRLQDVIGQVAARDLAAEAHLQFEDIIGFR